MMHLFFESLVIINVPSLWASLMDIHQDTSFRSILDNDSISLQKIMIYLIEKLNKKLIILTFGQFDHLVILNKSI